MSFIKRTLVVAIFAPLLTFLFYQGGYLLSFAIFVISIVGFYEMRKILSKFNIELPLFLAVLNIPYLLLYLYADKKFWFIPILLTIIVSAVRNIFKNHIKGSIVEISTTLFAIIYTVFCPAFMYHLRELQHGRVILVVFLLSIWATDTFAYLGGMLFGKHRGIVKVSPKKSVEGFVFGFIMSFLTPVLYKLFFAPEVHWFVYLSIGFSAGVAGQIGDLFESLIKRDADVKDSSNLIPGHGGILDRFDSLLFASPILYYIISLFFLKQ